MADINPEVTVEVGMWHPDQDTLSSENETLYTQFADRLEIEFANIKPKADEWRQNKTETRRLQMAGSDGSTISVSRADVDVLDIDANYLSIVQEFPPIKEGEKPDTVLFMRHEVPNRQGNPVVIMTVGKSLNGIKQILSPQQQEVILNELFQTSNEAKIIPVTDAAEE